MCKKDSSCKKNPYCNYKTDQKLLSTHRLGFQKLLKVSTNDYWDHLKLHRIQPYKSIRIKHLLRKLSEQTNNKDTDSLNHSHKQDSYILTLVHNFPLRRIKNSQFTCRDMNNFVKYLL